MHKSIKLLVMGLPRVGKTTYLAAFWHLLTSGEVRDSLVLAEMQPSRDHLNTIATLWRQWKEIPRTTLPKERVVTINVHLPNQAEVYELVVPDASGEAFKRIFETRRCSSEFEALASEAQSILLFLHPKQAIPPERIDLNVDKMSDALEEMLDGDSSLAQRSHGSEGDGIHEVNTAPVQPAIPATSVKYGHDVKKLEWNAKYSAYQAKLVDLLQTAARFRGDKSARLTIIISAWDRCAAEKLDPEAWLKKNLPLLYQYVMANADICTFEIFGVSAQGAELDNPGELVDAIRASDRINVAHGEVSSKDLTLPVKYLLGG